MPRQTESRIALPFYVADTTDGDDLALKMPDLPHLYQLQKDDEADFAVAHRWVRHYGYSEQLIH